MDVTEFYQTFFEEAEELLDDMERHLLALDIAAPDRDQLDAIFRAAHSIKGGAGTFGFQALMDTTHHMENLLDRLRRGEITIDAHGVDVLLATRDVLKAQIDAYRNSDLPDADAAAQAGAALARLATGAAPQDEPEATAAPAIELDRAPVVADGERILALRITGVNAAEQDALAEELALFGTVSERQTQEHALELRLQTSEAAEDIESVLCFIIDADQLTITPAPIVEPIAQTAEAATTAAPEAPAAAPERPEPGESASADSAAPVERRAGTDRRAQAGAQEHSSLRVATDKIDAIINLVGELVITQSMLEQTARTAGGAQVESLTEGIAQLQRNARDLQEAVMSIRMVPMDFAFNRFPRLVRDLGHKLDKNVEMETIGGATELDKGLIERIMDPLTHLVRNSLDHGIETHAKRLQAGKPAAGRLTLAARHEGGNILIEIRDDGAGLDRDRILAKARESGLTVSDAMDDSEVWQLIFAPGFSTAAEVTDVSGRGVGMDVVKRNILQLGGHVDLVSQTGVGTTVRIVLPLTLAITDGMTVRVGDEVFILPLAAVVESMRVDEAAARDVGGQGRVINVRGDFLPLVELHRLFDIQGAQTHLSRAIAVVVKSESRHFALVVDELVGQQQVVVKNLETHFRKVRGISAATILGDGKVALILDVRALSRLTPPLGPLSSGNALSSSSNQAVEAVQ
ncbi:MAG: chemotaxis protein CheA [Salinisphaera sp.]|jgi:two-component system chemotaxis sensor kinase CheA|nr:chemotaxis protein CheA [Salinisphaera sp.]